ncbi:hypothetical protein PQX77_011411 [Marasmius sp. AFHP31]|nr:hypothetical protein PQX77_011411 [Marasmius sp. AFHP31]
MDTRSLLQANCDRLIHEYQSNLDAAIELQTILIEDVLPSVATELELDEEQQDWARKWLQDTPMIFQVMRKHKYTRSFALDSIRKNIGWRIKNLWPPKSELPLRNVHCLPDNVRDPLGRPILVIRAIPLEEPPDQLIPVLFHVMERLRVCLKALNDTNDGPSMPFLQYVVLLDVKELSMQSMSIELITWFINELIPRFPGMLAAVFMLNSSWTQAGMWSIAKRILPANAVSRVFFPSSQELIEFFSTAALPQDYGGELGPLDLLDNNLNRGNLNPVCDDSACKQDREFIPEAPIRDSTQHPPTRFSPTSSSNPYFGYPAFLSNGSSSLHHGRKRKRDLFRTLMTLLWQRWRGPVLTCVWIVACALTARSWFRRSLHSSADTGLFLLKAWWASASVL